MKKIIGVLALVLLFTASAQAVTVTTLMDENFDSYAVDEDPAVVSGSGWVNLRSPGSTMLTVAGVDGGTIGVQPSEEAASFAGRPSVYTYAISDVTLGAGEFYRFDAFLNAPGSGHEEMVHLQLKTSDGRVFQSVLEGNNLLAQDAYEDTGYTNQIARIRTEDIGYHMALHARIDLSPDGMIGYYDKGAGWVEAGRAMVLADPEDPEDEDEPLLSVTGGIVELQVQFWTNNAANLVYADSFKLTVEAGTVSIPGDFDADNDVDGVDFGLWQAGYPTASGASLINGDADADGDVDGVDFGIWQANYPTNVGGATAIPEPATICLLALAGTVLLARRRR